MEQYPDEARDLEYTTKLLDQLKDGQDDAYQNLFIFALKMFAQTENPAFFTIISNRGKELVKNEKLLNYIDILFEFTTVIAQQNRALAADWITRAINLCVNTYYSDKKLVNYLDTIAFNGLKWSSLQPSPNLEKAIQRYHMAQLNSFKPQVQKMTKKNQLQELADYEEYCKDLMENGDYELSAKALCVLADAYIELKRADLLLNLQALLTHFSDKKTSADTSKKILDIISLKPKATLVERTILKKRAAYEDESDDEDETPVKANELDAMMANWQTKTKKRDYQRMATEIMEETPLIDNWENKASRLIALADAADDRKEYINFILENEKFWNAAPTQDLRREKINLLRK